jgi:hypothetical protein
VIKYEIFSQKIRFFPQKNEIFPNYADFFPTKPIFYKPLLTFGFEKNAFAHLTEKPNSVLQTRVGFTKQKVEAR